MRNPEWGETGILNGVNGDPERGILNGFIEDLNI